MKTWHSAVAWALATASLAGCGSDVEPTDGPACLESEWRLLYPATIGEAVDLVLVIDDSAGMIEEREDLTGALGTFVDSLLAPPDLDGDGVVDRVAIADLHVGVLSSDLGTGDADAPGCGPGHDGLFEHSPSDSVAGCDDSYPTYLSFNEGDDTQVLARDIECVAPHGRAGCTYQQPFEAVRRALVDQTDGPHEGFVRESSLLAIVLVTNGDDCSILPDGDALFDPAQELGPAATRCALAGQDWLEPVASYSTELLSLRVNSPDRLVVTAVAGIPLGMECPDTESSAGLACVLEQESMQPVADGDRLAPSCTSLSNGDAVPPARIVSLIRSVIDGGARAACAHSATIAPMTRSRRSPG